MNHRIFIPATATAIALFAAACGSSGDSQSSTADPVTESTTTVSVAEPTETVVEQPAADGSLTLDYTAYIEGAIQPSGLGVDAAASMAVIVTDFERVVVVDLETQNPVNEFGVGRNELPRQGATEGVAFVDDQRIAVLYPDDRIVGLFDLDGEALEEIVIETDGRIDGALTVIDGELVVTSRSGEDVSLLRIDLDNGGSTSIPLSGSDEAFEGLSPDAEPGGAVAVTAAGEVLHIDLDDGVVSQVGTTLEVADPSGLEVFLDSAEGEIQYGITDDDDVYNAEPSPLRLFLT